MSEQLPYLMRLGMVQIEINRLGLSYKTVAKDIAEMSRAAEIWPLAHAVDITTPKGAQLTGTVIGGMFMGDGGMEIPILCMDEEVDDSAKQVIQKNREALRIPSNMSDVREIYAVLGLEDVRLVNGFYLSQNGGMGEHNLHIKRYFSSAYEGWRKPGRWPLTDAEFLNLSAVSFVHDFNHVFKGKLQARPHKAAVSAESTA